MKWRKGTPPEDVDLLGRDEDGVLRLLIYHEGMWYDSAELTEADEPTWWLVVPPKPGRGVK